MTGRRAIVSLCMLCALMLSAFAAQSASASTKGTTAFTCKAESGGAGFSKAHCAPADAVASGASFKHVAIAENTATEARLSNEKTNATTTAATNFVLKSTFGGVAVTLTATGAEGAGTLTNGKAASGEHLTEGEGSATFTGVTANHDCTVWTDDNSVIPPVMGNQGVLHTGSFLWSPTVAVDALRVGPKVGNTFLTFWLTNCNPAAINGTYALTGSFTGSPEGAAIKFTHAATTAEETLLINGTVPAGIEGKLTLSARANSTQAYTPISPTTVETP